LSGSLALVAACGPSTSTAPSTPSTPATAATSAPATAGTPASAARPTAAAAVSGSPVRGGTLRIGLSVDVVTLDPHLSGSKFDRQVYHNLYDPLFILTTS